MEESLFKNEKEKAIKRAKDLRDSKEKIAEIQNAKSPLELFRILRKTRG